MNEGTEGKALEGLKIKATQGLLIRSWIKQPGFKIYYEKLQEVTEKYKKNWIKGSLEKSKENFFKAQGIQEALNILLKFQKIGVVAKTEITKHLNEDLN